MAAGVFALALSAQPCITWRDLQQLVADSAVVTDHNDSDWFTNAAGYHVNHKYGFGLLDAESLMQALGQWHTLPSQIMLKAPTMHPGVSVPAIQTLVFSACDDQNQTCIDAMEHVTIDAIIDTTDRGELSIALTCPSGTTSVLLFPRPLDDESGTFTWTYMTARCWGESPIGEWTLTLTHAPSSIAVSSLTSWRLTVYGVSQTADFSQYTAQVDAITIESSERENAVPCAACDANAFKAVGGTCWACDDSCDYGCFGPGRGGCITTAPPIVFPASPAALDHMTDGLKGILSY
jgi:subtilisin-like proprotein convertase family protein